MTENEKIDVNGIAGAVAKELAKLNAENEATKSTNDVKSESNESESFVCPECGTSVKGMTTYCPGCGCELEWES